MKQEKGISLVAAVVLAVVITVIVLVGGYFFYQFLQRPKGVNNNLAVENTVDNTIVINGQANTLGNQQIVVGGFKVTLPEGYTASFDSQGLLISDEDYTCQMRLVVREDSYESKMQNPKQLMQGALDAGATITQEITEKTINGKKYAYFTYELNGSKFVVAYTGANSTKRFGINAYDRVDIDTLLNAFDAIVKTAIETNEPDTTKEDLASLNKILPGTEEEYGRLTVEGKTVRYSVPSTFYSTGTYSYIATSAGETFVTEKREIDASYNLRKESFTQDADSYLKASASVPSDAKNVNVSEVKTETIGGKQIKYITSEYQKNYEEGLTTFKSLYAICLLSDNYSLNFKATTLKANQELNFDTVKGFFNIVEE